MILLIFVGIPVAQMESSFSVPKVERVNTTQGWGTVESYDLIGRCNVVFWGANMQWMEPSSALLSPYDRTPSIVFLEYWHQFQTDCLNFQVIPIISWFEGGIYNSQGRTTRREILASRKNRVSSLRPTFCLFNKAEDEVDRQWLNMQSCSWCYHANLFYTFIYIYTYYLYLFSATKPPQMYLKNRLTWIFSSREAN